MSVTAIDNRPLSEYLQPYDEARKAYKLLYYCRLCVRNFEAKERVAACPRCSRTSIVELPKSTALKRKQSAKVEFGESLKAFIAQARQAWLNLRPMLWKAKIAIFYFVLAPARRWEEMR